MHWGIVNNCSIFTRCSKQTAPLIFHQTMDQILPKLPGVVCYLGDILVTGKDEKRTSEKPRCCFTKITAAQLAYQSTKCKFMQDNVEYLGQVVSKHGKHTSEGKVEAILEMSPTNNQRSLRLLLDFVNHYRKLLSFLVNLSAPMNKLLKKDALNRAKFYNSKKFKWNVLNHLQ